MLMIWALFWGVNIFPENGGHFEYQILGNFKVFYANSIWCTMVRRNLNAWFQRTTLIPCINKKTIAFIFHTIIGKNNNVNLADFGAKFTHCNSLYITVVNIGNVHVHVHVYSCIATTQNKFFFKLHNHF